jgi:hypothetical protein
MPPWQSPLENVNVAARSQADIREILIKSKFVIPANAEIQKDQRTGHRLSPV